MNAQGLAVGLTAIVGAIIIMIRQTININKVRPDVTGGRTRRTRTIKK
jgi:hypothetical protein